MKFTAVASKAILVVLLAAAVCLNAADTPTVTVKGSVLDSACAFTKGLSKPISKDHDSSVDFSDQSIIYNMYLMMNKLCSAVFNPIPLTAPRSGSKVAL
jgi:hypothetical protein